MEQLPLTFVQATVEPDIQECFTPAFNFTKLSSGNGRLAFTQGKIYYLPDEPIALLNQGWWIAVNEIDSYGKWGLAGFSIKLKDGKELRFSNVSGKMRDGIAEAIEAHKGDAIPEAAAPAAEAPAEGAAAAAAAAPEAAKDAPKDAPEAPAADAEFDPADASANKVMSILAYLGILVLIPLFAAKESKFSRFHVNQGLILLLISVVLFVVGKIIPSLNAIIWILNIGVFVLAIMGIINAAKGEAKELPLVGKFRIIS